MEFTQGMAAVVTGGASGLGKASAEALAEAGLKVTVAEPRKDKGGGFIAYEWRVEFTFIKDPPNVQLFHKVASFDISPWDKAVTKFSAGFCDVFRIHRGCAKPLDLCTCARFSSGAGTSHKRLKGNHFVEAMNRFNGI